MECLSLQLHSHSQPHVSISRRYINSTVSRRRYLLTIRHHHSRISPLRYNPSIRATQIFCKRACNSASTEPHTPQSKRNGSLSEVLVEKILKGTAACSIALLAIALHISTNKGQAVAAPAVSATVEKGSKKTDTAQALRTRARNFISLEALKKKEGELVKEAQKILDSYNSVEKELEKFAEEDEGRYYKENELKGVEKQFKDVWSSLTRLEAEILSIETESLRLGSDDGISHDRQLEQDKALSGVREEGGLDDIAKMEKQLEYHGKKAWERRILPVAVGAEDPETDKENANTELAEQLRKEFEYSTQMQEKLENLIREQFKNAGKETLKYDKRSHEEIYEGLAPLEAKWLFGDKEVIVPEAAGFQMAQEWKKWREEAKTNMKKKLLEDIEEGKKYVSEIQARILLYRDRVLSKTWYSVSDMQWEMDPVAAAYAISKQLVGKACIRHDWRKMFLVLKGDETEYQVDIQDYNDLFERVGGFDGLYIKMASSGIPIKIEKRQISFKELGLFQRVQCILKFSVILLLEIGRRDPVAPFLKLYFGKLFTIFEDFMYWVGFKALETYVPRETRVMLGMAWPEAADEAFANSGFLEWQTAVGKRLDEYVEEQSKRQLLQGQMPQTNLTKELFFIAIRFLFYASPIIWLLFCVARALCIRFNDVFRTGSFVLRKAREKYRRLKEAEKRYLKLNRGKEIYQRHLSPLQEANSIKEAFDEMKRVRNPPVRLRDFAGIESIKDEVTEIISFLRNPKSFQKIGARAPRGILITGSSGSGKTTLAYAIAAEAKVPVVSITNELLTVGEYVGESAANVRELFQTARQLAPVIIFMDRFESIGIRGNKTETLVSGGVNKQEEIINQFLVELDGFETKEGVVVLATTSEPESIDEALRRPGRMDKTIALPRPNEKEREKILLAAAKKSMHNHFIDIVDWQTVAKKTAGMVPAELQLVPESLECAAISPKICDADELLGVYGWLATIGQTMPGWVKSSKLMKMFDEGLINHLGLQLTREDVKAAVESFEMYHPPLELYNCPTPNWTKEAKLPHAVWAAGRGLVAYLLPNFDKVEAIWLDPTSWEGIGFTKLTRETTVEVEDKHIESRSHMEKRLVLCFGSYVASRMLLPHESNTLSTPELKEGMKIATQMVLQYGWGPTDNPMVYFTDISPVTLTMGREKESELAGRVDKVYYSACDKATEMLQKNRKALDALVAYLLENESMVHKDVCRILNENGVKKEPEPFMLFGKIKENVHASISMNGSDRNQSKLSSSI